MEKTTKLTVTNREEGTSLLDFLANQLGISGKRAKRLLDSRGVLVNRKRVWMARHTLNQEDKVEILKTNMAPASEQFPILYDDPEYLVVNKPPGILTNGPRSIEEYLRTDLNSPSLSVAHRLDRDTSGCLLLARNADARERVVSLFRRHKVGKSYHAIVSGRFPPTQTITRPLENRRAVTHVKRLDANKKASHLLIAIETGRTHQIRKHLSSMHHPVLGDKHYGAGKALGNETVHVNRQMLHASHLQFDHPATGGIVRIKAPLPRDFRKCLKTFRLT